jgi:hypothetical protein
MNGTRRFRFLSLFSLVSLLLLIGSAALPGYAVGAIRDNAGFNSNAMFATDDGSTGLVNIGFTINFFGMNFSQLYVNNNGNVTFDSPLNEYTPFSLTSTGQQIIAPFFADVDTRGGKRHPLRSSCC